MAVKPPLVLRPAFDFGQRVWHVADAETPGIIIGLYVAPDKQLRYIVAWRQGRETTNYDLELSDTPLFTEQAGGGVGLDAE